MEGPSSAYPQTIFPELVGRERRRPEESSANRKVGEFNRDHWLRSAADEGGIGKGDIPAGYESVADADDIAEADDFAEVIDDIESAKQKRGAAAMSSPPKKKKKPKKTPKQKVVGWLSSDRPPSARQIATLDTGLEDKDLDIPQEKRRFSTDPMTGKVRVQKLLPHQEYVYGEELPLPEGWTPTAIPRSIGSLKKKKKKKSKKPKKKKSKKPKKPKKPKKKKEGRKLHSVRRLSV